MKKEDLLKIAEPNTEQNDKGKVKAMFYLDDLLKKIESEKVLMRDKVLEEIIFYAEKERQT